MKNTKENMRWLWRNAEKVLIVTFFLTFTLNIRKVFLTPYSFLNGGFNEYMTMSFSWADLLMLATIVIYTTKSILRQVINPYYASSGHEKAFKNVSRETLYLLIFLGWVGLSIFWSQYRLIAVYRVFIFIETALFACVAIRSLNQPKWLKMASFAIITNGLFQSLLGIAQFIHNGSLGLHSLGESILGPNIDGVAKILISGEKHIRAYGTLPHPNILAGFLIIPLFIILAEFVQRKSLLISSRPSPYQGEGGDNFPLLYKERARVRCDKVSHETFLRFIPRWILFVILIITGIGFGLTLSRSAFLGLFVGLASYFAWITFSWRSIKVSKVILKFLPLLVLIIALAIIILINNTSFFSNQSLEERQLYQHVSYETISGHPVMGVGIGQFIINEYKMNSNLESWQYQPVHNIYLLAFSELGIVGLAFFLLWIFSILEWGSSKNRNTGLLLTKLTIYCIILSFLVISFFDHYFWNLKQGLLIFVLPLIILYTHNEENRKIDKEL